jgi:hypothetical protein
MQEEKVVNYVKNGDTIPARCIGKGDKIYTQEELFINQDATACGSFLKGGSVIGMSKMGALNAIENELDYIKENIRYLKQVLE